MDYKEQIRELKSSFGLYCIKEPNAADKMIDAAQSITDLLARAEAAEADNKKLIAAMMQLKRTENFERMSVIYELEYDSSLSHKTMEEVAEILFKGILDADLKQRKNKEE